MGREKELKEGTKYPVHQVAVVDIDRDGFDDFYYASNEGPAFFFRNRGDGSFEEIAKELGLALERLNGAFFADFDNDGDSDAFVTYYNKEEGTHYLRNENGRFVQRNDLVEVPLPAWTLPINVSDYDNDGLLDVFLGRYAAPYIRSVAAADEEARNNGLPGKESFLFMAKEESDELWRRVRSPDANPIVNRSDHRTCFSRTWGAAGLPGLQGARPSPVTTTPWPLPGRISTGTEIWISMSRTSSGPIS